LPANRRDALVTQAEERWVYFDHHLHRAAYALDPEHQMHSWHTDTFITEALEDCFERYYGDDTESVAKAEAQLETYRTRSGRFAREACVINMEKMSSWAWWAKYGGNTPELQRFAMEVLSLVAGACSCERNWSAFDFVHSKKRNKLSAEKSAELVYIFSNLRLLRKITAGDKVEFFYAWRKDGDKGVAAGANERSEELIQSMDMDVCEATSEEDCEPESELDSDEISEDEDDYGRQ
jgi:hypothetical protein